jgi:hypothetical protein
MVEVSAIQGFRTLIKLQNGSHGIGGQRNDAFSRLCFFFGEPSITCQADSRLVLGPWEAKFNENEGKRVPWPWAGDARVYWDRPLGTVSVLRA